jgi:rubredoxin
VSDPSGPTKDRIEARSACPRCGSAKVAQILWGYPRFSEELEADLAAGRVVLGGCMVGPDQASHACTACGLEFRSDGRPVRAEEDGW